MMARGVPAGATTPIHVETSLSAGDPASTASERSPGKLDTGPSFVFASARNIPAWISGKLAA